MIGMSCNLLEATHAFEKIKEEVESLVSEETEIDVFKVLQKDSVVCSSGL